MSALERLERATWDTRVTVQTADVRWLLERHTALVGMLKQVTDDLEAEIEGRSSGELPRRIERDLSVVRDARELIGEQE